MQRGHAIECRIYAEDPDKNFMPSPGVIRHLTEPLGTGVRQDGYVYEGFEIPIFYDPMISKLIVWGRDRDEAIQRMKRALMEYKITGVKTSIPFLMKIMEKAKQVAVVPVDIGWDDVGNWGTLSELVAGDGAENVMRGQGRPVLLDTEGTYVYASAGRLVATIGLENFIVVDTPDALLICPKDQAQDVREVVAELKAKGLREYL